MQAVADFDYHLFGTRVRFADGCVRQLPDAVAELGCRRPALLMQARFGRSPAGKSLLAALADQALVVVDDIPAHGDLAALLQMLPRIRAHVPDCVIAVGGGSVADTAKALVLLLADDRSLSAYQAAVAGPGRMGGAKLPIISVPTTASAAELTPSIGLADGAHKRLFWSREVAATEVLIDPQLAVDVPHPLLLGTAINGIAHSLEGLYSSRRSPVSDALALQSLALFANALQQGAEPAWQRRQILAAAHLSGLVLSLARTCLHHALCHAIGARFSVAHGAINSVMLPHVLDFNAPAAGPALAAALQAVNQQAQQPWTSVSAWVRDLRCRYDLPCALTPLGVAAGDLPGIARETMLGRGVALNPRPVTDAVVLQTLLEQALHSQPPLRREP